MEIDNLLKEVTPQQLMDEPDEIILLERYKPDAKSVFWLYTTLEGR